MTEPQPQADSLSKLGKRSDAIIAGLIALQILVPVSYYIGSDRSDERFAWRMFSTVRVESCGIAADEELREGRSGSEGVTRTVDLARTIHSAWRTALERDRAAVVRRFLEARCDQPDVAAARLVRTCRVADGTMRTPEEVRMDCRTGDIARREVVAP